MSRLTAQEDATAASFYNIDGIQAILLRDPGSFSNRDVCIFAAYSSGKRLSDATCTYIEQFKKHDFIVILCIAIDDLNSVFNIDNLYSVDGIIIRENTGFDFSSWSSALRILPVCRNARRLVFANDSVFVLPDLFPDFINRLRSAEFDFFGVTDSYEYKYHVQSYLFGIRNISQCHSAVYDFFCNMPVYSSKIDVIRQLEVNLSSIMKNEFDLSVGVIFPTDFLFAGAHPDFKSKLNVCNAYWDLLVFMGSPFVKVELIRDNRARADIGHWRMLFERFGASVEVCLAHMAIPRTASKASRAEKSLSVFEDPAGRGLITRAEARDAGLLDRYEARTSAFGRLIGKLRKIRLDARRRRRARRSAARAAEQQR